eukprot:CAMPEP_0180309766 /NCGR_PEP_ID=MMETSP0988-20121125/29297_1 /TAXON_ID=697907 /ORGANISM="non described non described, Strain CCMP2293" /LENGTH=118 /DNA_ID=CAMNT_0022293613 /DNA_START=1 /DNA_END=357 /DNA_ORIENTATION=-
MSFRGLFWYPSGGFDSWHTDSNLLSGWRLYLVDPHLHADYNSSSIRGRGRAASFLAYRHPVSQRFLRSYDEPGFANMFQVSPKGHQIWHAVASLEGHRISLGLGISDTTAARALSPPK